MPQTVGKAATAPSSDVSGAPARRGAVLGLILGVQLLNAVDVTVMNMALPQIQNSLDFTPATLSWVVNAYTLAYGGLLLLGGRLGDILGQRRALMVGVAIFTLASLAGGPAQEPWMLLVARACQGAGAAIATPTTMALIVRLFTDPGERTRALGVTVTASGIGSAAGLLLGGLLTDFGSWRWVLFINVPVGAVVLALAPRIIPKQESKPAGAGFDVIGAVLVTLGMTSLVHGFVRAASDGFSDSLTIISFVLAVVLLAALVGFENRHPAPVLDLRLFADRNRAAGFITFVCSGAAMFGTFFFLTQLVQEVLGFSPFQAGLAFLAMAVPMTVVPKTLTPRIVEAAGARTTMTAGLGLVVTSMLWLTQLDAGATYWSGVVGPMALAGAGVGLLNPPLAGTILATVEPAQAGAASGLLQTVAMLGASVGTAILVTIYGAALRGHGDVAGGNADALSYGISHAYIGGVVFAVVGLVIVTFVVSAGGGRRPAA
jgi:EmrB/QacA subfamily drug resistance transporter